MSMVISYVISYHNELRRSELLDLQVMDGDLMFTYDGLTRFEKTRIISARALQISMGAPVLIKSHSSDPKDVAKEEFEKNVLPITIRRRPPKKIE